jgi:hypothetical protein
MGDFLGASERQRILDAEHSSPGVIDAWWDAKLPDAPEKFGLALGIAEPRFLAQEGLVIAVRSSERMRLHEQAVRSVIACTQASEREHNDASRMSATESPWPECAEAVLVEENPNPTAQLRERLALDAWRCHLLLDWR